MRHTFCFIRNSAFWVLTLVFSFPGLLLAQEFNSGKKYFKVETRFYRYKGEEVSGNYELQVRYPGVISLLKLHENGDLKLYSDPSLTKELDQKTIEQGFTELVNLAMDPNPDFEKLSLFEKLDRDLIGLNGGVVEVFKKKGDKLKWKRECGWVEGFDLYDEKKNFRVYFEAWVFDEYQDLVSIRQWPGGCADAMVSDILDSHDYAYYPDRLKTSKKAEWQAIPPRATENGQVNALLDDWNQSFADGWLASLEPAAGNAIENCPRKENYVMGIPATVHPKNSHPGIVPKPGKKLENEALINQVLTPLLNRVLEGEVKLYNVETGELIPDNVAEMNRVDPSSSSVESSGGFDDWGDNWGDETYGEDDENKGLADTSAFLQEISFIGELVRKEGKVSFKPEKVILTWTDPAKVLPSRTVGFLNFSDVKETVNGKSVVEFLNDRNYHSYVHNIGDYPVSGFDRSWYLDYFLWNDWEAIPDLGILMKMKWDYDFEPELKKLYLSE